LASAASRPSTPPARNASQSDAGGRLSTATPGRPTLLTDTTVRALCALIRQDGISDSGAARRLGIGKATISRWKAAHPDLELALDQARELFREDKLRLILNATKSNGMPDWRAAAWLLEHIFPEDYALNRKRNPAPTPPAQTAHSAEPAPSIESTESIQSTDLNDDTPTDAIRKFQNSSPSPDSDSDVHRESKPSSEATSPERPITGFLKFQKLVPQSQPRLPRRDRRRLEREQHRAARESAHVR
jgi:hypothetical protein